LTVLNTKRIQRTGKEPVMATTKDKDRQKKWKEKQKAHGKKSVTIMLDKYVKDLIDKERKRTGFSTASIIELAILNHLGLSSEQLEIIKQGRRPVPMETLQEIANGLLDFVSKIERLSGIKAVPTSARISLVELIRKRPNYQKEIKFINLMRRSGGRPSTIAYRLNMTGSKPFRGGEEWLEDDIKELFEEFDVTDLERLEYETPKQEKRQSHQAEGADLEHQGK
jgi:hypothetical protein